MINQQILSGHWNELTGQLKQRWGQLTDQELEQVEGNGQQLIGLIQRKTGESREEIERELDDLVEEEESLVSRASDRARATAERASRSVRHGYEQVTDSVAEQISEAEQIVRNRPMESLAVAFGSGLIAGVIVGLVARSR